MNDILHHQLRHNLPQTQDECVAISVRQSLAMYGRLDGKDRDAACRGMVKGLFGPAWTKADMEQRFKWVNMAKRQYQIAVGE